MSSHAALAERIRQDQQVDAEGFRSPFGAFRLQALYLDFARSSSREDLIEAIGHALQAPREAPGPGDSPAARDGVATVEDPTQLRELLARLSRRALLTALVFDTHFQDMRVALEVVAGGQPLERIATGICAFVAEQRIGGGLGGDPHYFAPLRERQAAFCYHYCLPTIRPQSSEDQPCPPERTTTNCGMLRVLDAFRFFASFPDEP